MAVFDYKALNIKGKKVSGIIDAESTLAAKLKLRKQNIFPSSLTRIESTSKSDKKKGRGLLSDIQLFSRISSAELTLITRQLSTLLSAGFPLVKALSTLIPQTKTKMMKKVLSRVKDAVEEGNSFASALALHPAVFSPIFRNMIKAGESSGTLEIVLERLADFTENKEASKKKIQAALAYPIIMSIMGAGILVFLLSYVVPGIVSIFTDMDQTLPLPTTLLIHTSDFFASFWWAIALSPLVVIAVITAIRKTKKGRYITDKIILSLPILGNLIRKNVSARLTRTLSSLLENGVPLLAALKITKNVAGNTVMTQLISQAYDTVERGGELGSVLAGSKHFPDLAAQMILIGEESGELEKMLEKTADLFEKDVQAALTAATALIEPLIIVFLGLIVAFIVMAICLPIFEINQLIQ